MSAGATTPELDPRGGRRRRSEETARVRRHRGSDGTGGGGERGAGRWRERQTASAAERRSRSSREMLSVDGFAPAGQPVRRSPGSFASAARDDLVEGATSGDFDAI
jgi:hypothetical protein